MDMPRIRTVKPEYFTHMKVAQLTHSARYLFIGLFILADDIGVLQGYTPYLRSQIFGMDEWVTNELTEGWLNEIVSQNLLIPFDFTGSKYYVIKSFNEHQCINRPSKTKFDKSFINKVIEEHSRSIHGVFTEYSVSTHGSLTAGKEGKGRERKGKEHIVAKVATDGGKKFADWFKTKIPETMKTTDSQINGWAKTFDDLIRLDGKDEKTIYEVVEFARKDSFLSPNFLSANKLRKTDKNGVQYFDIYEARMNLRKSPTANETPQGIQSIVRGAFRRATGKESGKNEVSNEG